MSPKGTTFERVIVGQKHAVKQNGEDIGEDKPFRHGPAQEGFPLLSLA